MPTPEGSVALPEIVTRHLRSKRTHEEREFTQTELSIEGEARMLSIVREAAKDLTDDGFPWDKLGPLFDEGPTDWEAAVEILGHLSSRVPEACVDMVATLLGIFPTDEDGTLNDTWDRDRRFIKSSIKFADLVDYAQVFARQNDYERLAAPIGAILGTELRTKMATNTNGTSADEPTTDDSSKPLTALSRKATARRAPSSDG